jgi:ubiquinone/menaquinone biosynthesis C-methylase UbiE
MDGLTKAVLHVGCGVKRIEKLHSSFRGPDWREIRYDIDPTVEPDILGDITNLSEVDTASMEAVWSSHNIEHVFAHQVPIVLREFLRVLKPGGQLLVTCPDIQPVAALVAEGNLTGAAYHSPAGPVSPLDIIFGYGPSIARGYPYMAHKTAFTKQTMATALANAGFANISVVSGREFDLWARAYRPA